MAERTEERDDDVEVEVEENLDDIEPTEEDLEDAASATADPAGADVESIHEVLEKQEARDDEEDAEEEPAAVVTTAPDERIEPLDARVIPMQSSEFVCKNCYLVKHRSQLADKRRMFCRDCA